MEMPNSTEHTDSNFVISFVLLVFSMAMTLLHSFFTSVVNNVDIISKLLGLGLQLLSGISLILIIFINFNTAKDKFKGYFKKGKK